MGVHYNALVCIDHHEANIFHFDATDFDRVRIHNSHPHEHLHHKANSRGSGHVPVDHAFLERVAKGLMHAGAILITGPASANTELTTHLKQVHPELAKRVSGVETLDHPTEGALVAFARSFFRADDRIHSQM
jgi:hypothetical protein